MENSKGKELVSILVLNYNHKEQLATVFNSIRTLSSKLRYEPFLVDNASSDGSVEYVSKNFPEVRIVETGGNLGTAGFNVALKSATGSYLAWVGCDTKFHPESLVRMVNLLKLDKRIAAVYPDEVDFSGKTADIGLAFSRTMYFFPTPGHKRLVDVPGVGPGMIRRSILVRIVYLYDPLYFYSYEDNDLAMRLRLLGYKVVLGHGCYFYHMGSLSFKKRFSSPYRIFLGERNSLITMFKIFEWKNILLFFPYSMLIRTALMIRDLIALKPGNAFARLRAVIWIFANFGTVLKKRRETQKLRVVPDSEVFRGVSDEGLFISAFFDNLLRRHTFDIYKSRKEKAALK